MESAEKILGEIVKVVALSLEFAAVLCIVAGFLKTFILLFERKKTQDSPLYIRLRFQFGG